MLLQPLHALWLLQFLLNCHLHLMSVDISHHFEGFSSEVIRQTQGVEILKLPVGSDDFIRESLQKRVNQMASTLDRLEILEDSHIEFTMLRACLGSAKLAYALRGLAPSDRVLTVLRDADEVLRLAFEKIMVPGENLKTG